MWSSGLEAPPASLPLGCRAGQSWRKGRFYCWRGFFSPASLSPSISIHLPREVEAAADIGAGSISYVNACVCKSRPLTPGVVPASIAVSPAGSGRRAWRASRSSMPSWLPRSWEALPDPCLHARDEGCCSGMDPAPTAPAPVGLGSPGLSAQSPSRVSRGSGCHGPEVMSALGSAQETHLITNLLPG